MKRKFIAIFSLVCLICATGTAYSKTNMDNELVKTIQMYKNGNYTECYATLSELVNNDINPIAYYYLAMSSAQLGKRDEAIENYEKAMSLITTSSNLYRYAEKGKRCLEDPEKCSASGSATMDEFIKNNKARFSDEVYENIEKLKIENMMREMNRSNDIDPRKFKEYKDFSDYKDYSSQAPSNDEIVAAIRVLKNAGLYDTNNILNSSLIGGFNTSSGLTGLGGNSAIDSQSIKNLLTNNMLLGF